MDHIARCVDIQTTIARTEADNSDPRGIKMVIPEKKLKMSKKDENGLHHMHYEECKGPGPCFSFDLNGRTDKCCGRFRKLPTGVKLCLPK